MSKTDLRSKICNPNRKLLCIEVNPPRGTDTSKVFSRLDKYLTDVDFFNVTDSPLSKMRMNPISFAALLKQKYCIEPLVNLSCRDRNQIAMQGSMLAGWNMGVQSIVALTGDALSVGDNPECKAVFEVNSVGLLETIKTLNSGQDIAGNVLEGAPNICPGSVVNPNARNSKAEIKKLEKKKNAGAVYALSQPVFDVDTSVSFFKEAAKVGIPIFAGLLPFRKAAGLLALQKIPGIKISEELIAKAQANSDQDFRSYSFELCKKIALANQDYVCGYHVICGPTPISALKLTSELRKII